MQPSQSFWNRFIDKQSNTLITNQKSRKKRRIQQTRSDNNNNNSSSNNNNNKNNTAQYGAGLVPEENEDEIDCSKFSDLDELPPFCQENPDGQGGGGDGTAEDDALPDSQVQPPPDDAASGTMIGTGETVLIDNTIQVPFSLGIYLYDEMTEQRSEDLVSLVVQVTSILLDRYTPFDVYAPSPEDDLILIEMDDGEAGGFGDGIDGDDSNGRFEDNGTQLLASMYFSSVTVWDSPFWNSWLQLSIAYAVVWPNGEPLVDPVDLQQVELAARQVFNMTVDALKFWEELVDQDFNGHYVMQDGETWNESAIMTVAKLGEEYDLGGAGERGAYLGNGTSDFGSGGKHPATLDKLTTDWSTREWFGLALCLSTFFVATVLAAVSSHLQHRQQTKSIWGLTEQGVGELLKVGWNYHQEGNGQLFLKVFDKGQMGYSDDNSVLQGNVIMEGIDSHEVSLTSATTATPAS